MFCYTILRVLLVLEQGACIFHFAMDASSYVAYPAGREVEQRLALAWTRLPASWAASPGCLHPGTSTARASGLYLTSETWPLLGKSEEHSSRLVREAGDGPGRCSSPEIKQEKPSGASPALRNQSHSAGASTMAQPSLWECHTAFLPALQFQGQGTYCRLTM